jgi:flagellar biosynthesis/type III secretory pathway protein FliH
MKIRKEYLQQLIDEGYDDTFESGYDAAYMDMPANHDWYEYMKGFQQAIEDMYFNIQKS